MSEMIERVARAIQTAMFEKSPSPPPEDLRVALSLARAAIEAMREPTSDMIQSAIPELLYDDQQECIGAAYTAMIDQALIELSPLRPAGSADIHDVPMAEE